MTKNNTFNASSHNINSLQKIAFCFKKPELKHTNIGFNFMSFTIILCAIGFSFSCKQKPREYTPQQRQAFEENLLKANKGLVSQDQESIANYAEIQNWEMQKTETGLWYQIVKQNKKPKAKIGQVAQIRYQVNLLNGTFCYSSDSTGIKEFKIGQGGIESGLEEGILLLSEGEAARFIMPPHLAHGLLGDENKIPPRSTIVYNVELLKLTD